MALLEHEEHAGAPPRKGKGDKQHRDSMVIIIVGVVGVILTFLIYRSSKAAKTATAAGGPITSASMGSGAGTVLSPGGSANVGAGGANNGLLTQDQFAAWLDGSGLNQVGNQFDTLWNQGNDINNRVFDFQQQQDQQQSALAGLVTRLEAITTHNTDTNQPASPWSAPIGANASPVYAQPWPALSAPQAPASPAWSSVLSVFGGATSSAPPPTADASFSGGHSVFDYRTGKTTVVDATWQLPGGGFQDTHAA